jgi:predicted TIM-barrel fold metal-dependent hydrolase
MEDFAARGKDVMCPGPDPDPAPPSRFIMPAGAVDAHAHVIGPPPYNPERGYTPGEHPIDEYLRVLDACGLAFGVLVQPTVHADDNGVMLSALRAHPDRLRGVAVIAPTASDREIATLKDAGVVGLRLVAAASGGMGLRDLDRYEALCGETGWHLQVMVNGDRLGASAARLRALRVPLVIDHLGYFPVHLGPSSAAANDILSLLKGGAWIKLSGAFRVAREPGFADAVPIARAFIAAAPERCVWGSDWPHVNFWSSMPRMGALLDLLHDWAPDPSQRDLILSANARTLYGLDKADGA